MKNRYSPRILGIITVCIATALAVTRSSGQGSSEGYRGVEAVLQQAAETQQSTTNKTLSPTAQLRADMKSFAKQSATLTPPEAATQWLALVDRFIQLTASAADSFGQTGDTQPLQPQELIEALPPPGAWTELAKAIESRPSGQDADAVHQVGLRLLAHTLTGDTVKRQEDLNTLQSLAAKAKSNQANFYNSLFDQLSSSLLALQDNPDAVLQALESKIANQRAEEFYEPQLQIPDLVSLVGPQKAEAFLRDALVKTKDQLEIDNGTATDTLAQKLALELVGQLKAPQWSLVNSLDSVDLYEALEKRFGATETNQIPVAIPGMPSMAVPAQTPGDYQKQNARIYYLLGLISQGRTTNAVEIAEQFKTEENVSIPDEVVHEMERDGFTMQLNDFFHELLQQDPELPFWDEYVQLAANAEQTSQMVVLVQTSMAKPDLSKNQRAHLRQLLCQALLADDQVEAGVAELRQLLQTNEQPFPAMRFSDNDDRGHLGLQLAQIGHLLNHPEWQEEGIAVAKDDMLKPQTPYDYLGDSTAILLAKFLEEIGRGPEAESVLALALSNAVARQSSAPQYESSDVNSPSSSILGALARLYHDAGRNADVIKLFDQAPYWGAKDLAKLNTSQIDLEDLEPSFSFKHTPVPVGYYLASALAKTGHPDEGHKILDVLLTQSAGCDRLYELLLSLDDEQVPAELDVLFGRDQFEERPLIWKAHYLRAHQRLAEAEQTARKAISIDPTDGEEGPGDRLRAYGELAEIRAAQGDTNEAATLHGAVEAVQEVERADQYESAGLLKRAVVMYQDSLTHFANAYCIHARLAILFSDMGQFDKAEEHYRRAYELMPDSFGRVESYCFGCQRAFDGERAQGIAEKVFTQLVQQTPNKPQVHYLLGYLRDEEGRYQEAMTNYLAAVRLDPDYLNAWAKIASLSDHVFQTATNRDAVVFNLLRLDPLGRHTCQSFNSVSDLAALWNNVAMANSKQPVAPDNLYPLAASKLEIEKQEEQNKTGSQQQEMMNEVVLQQNGQTVTPGAAIAQNAFIQAAQTMLGQDATMAFNE